MKYFQLFSIAFFAVLSLSAQDRIPTVVVGDTAYLSVTGAVGNIQWQTSTDSLIWTDLPGIIGSDVTVITTASATGKKYYRAAVSEPLCPVASPWYSSVISHIVRATTVDIIDGDYFRGGNVYMTSTTENGITPGSGWIAYPTDYPIYASWGCRGFYLPGTNSSSDGRTNTENIIYYCGDYTAAYYASTFEAVGYDDWYLPSYSEAWPFVNKRDIVGGLQGFGFYLTSTQADADSAYIILTMSWGGGGDSRVQKDVNYVFRCVRTYTATDNLRHVISTATISFNPTTVTVALQPQSQVKCLGSDVSFSVQASGTGPYTYQWKKEGDDISGANQPNLSLTGLTLNDDGFYICDVTNLCRTTSSVQAQLKVIQVSVIANIDTTICLGQGAVLSAIAHSNYPAESGAFSYYWTPVTGLNSQNQATTSVNANLTTTYTVQATDQYLSCSASDETIVVVREPWSQQELCLVTVDPEVGKNKIMYEKALGVGISSFLIYKETTTTNVYDILVALDATEDGEFIDYFSQPEVHGDKYRISVIDTCNNQSEMSFYHKTVNLVIGSAGSTMGLLWDDYVDESGDFVPYRYYIYRGTSPVNLALYDSVPGTLNSYNDVNVFDVYYYMIGVKKAGGCNTSGSDEFLAFSNKKDNATLVNISTNEYAAGTILISPNPMTDFATLTIPNLKSAIRNPQPTNPQSAIRILDVTGKLVRTEPLSSMLSGSSLSEYEASRSIPDETALITILRGDLKPGIYFVELKADRIYREKLIVE